MASAFELGSTYASVDEDVTIIHAKAAAPAAPTAPEVPAPEPEVYERPFNQTYAYRILSRLGVLDPSDPTGKTVIPSRRYIRATLPDGQNGVRMEAVYRIEGITNHHVSLSYVEVDPETGKKYVRPSERGSVDHVFWEARTFLVVTEAEWLAGKTI